MTEFWIAYAYYPWVRLRLQGAVRRVLAQRRRPLQDSPLQDSDERTLGARA